MPTHTVGSHTATYKGIVILISGLLSELQREFKNEDSIIVMWYVFTFSDYECGEHNIGNLNNNPLQSIRQF